MVFVLEKISEEDMKKYGLESKLLEKISEEGMKLGLNLTRGCGSNREYVVRSGARGDWAIDKERNVFLIKVSGAWDGGNTLGIYELHYPDVGFVEFIVKESLGHDPKINSTKFNNSCKFVLTNTDLSLKIPNALNKKVESIRRDICESLYSFGYSSNHKKNEVDVRVTFPEEQKIYFKKGD